MMHQSIATINAPEFINLEPLDINPLMSKCEIKVLYLGENRNRSYISKEVATEMAKTLRGAPIVGYYKEEKEDFADHGEQVIFDDEGIKFNCLTKPYGFVSPDAQVWFQEFEDTDDFGNKIKREYLMTTGFLWTEQFEESKRVVEKGNNQSMELDEKTLDGHWSTNVNNGMEFFIINDAIFSKLCILGEDVEPCFEGATITAPTVSKTFTKVDDNFRQTLFTMMQDLKFALEGGKNMEIEERKEIEENTLEETANVEESSMETIEEVEENTEEDNSVSDIVEDETPSEELADENSEEDSIDTTIEENENSLEEEASEESSISIDEYNLLKNSYDELTEKYNELVAFKDAIELKEKESLIDSFYMLSEEDKKDVKENINKYSKDEIEAKLSVICVRNKVNFDQDTSDKNDNKVEEENSAITTFNLNDNESSSIPAWVSACINTQNSKK